jgi:hypothetical protein
MGGSSTSPLSIGSFLNGIGTNLASGGNTIKGALMNASLLAGSGNGGSAIDSGYGSSGESLFGFDPTPSSVGSDIWSGIKGTNTWMNQNPVSAQMGMQLAKSLMQPDQPIPYAPAGQIQRGQIAPMDYMSLLNPQQQSVIRPQSISLLG